MRASSLTSLAATGCLLLTSVASAVVVNFENYTDATNNDYRNNFRVLWSNATAAQTNAGAANDYVHLDSGAAIVAYDTTPADGAVKNTFTLSGAQTFTLTANVAFKSDNSSLGVYIIDPNSESSATAYLALFNINTTANNEATDWIRFAPDANPTVSSNAGTIAGGAKASALARNAPLTPLSVTYSLSGTSGILTMSVGSYSAFTTIPNGRSTFEIGLRLAAQGTSTADNLTFDNVSMSIPEPASLGLLGMTLLPLARRRRH